MRFLILVLRLKFEYPFIFKHTCGRMGNKDGNRKGYGFFMMNKRPQTLYIKTKEYNKCSYVCTCGARFSFSRSTRTKFVYSLGILHHSFPSKFYAVDLCLLLFLLFIMIVINQILVDGRPIVGCLYLTWHLNILLSSYTQS